MSIAYVGLGSNLADPVRQINAALLALGQLPATQVLRASSLYQTAPVDCPAQGLQPVPDFINAVAAIETDLSPEVLLTQLLAIENVAGRERPYVNAPRVLDCDLLLYDQQECSTSTLTLPHPRMHQRGFVLLPLAEIAADIVIPQHGNISQLLNPSLSKGIKKLSS